MTLCFSIKSIALAAVFRIDWMCGWGWGWYNPKLGDQLRGYCNNPVAWVMLVISRWSLEERSRAVTEGACGPKTNSLLGEVGGDILHCIYMLKRSRNGDENLTIVHSLTGWLLIKPSRLHLKTEVVLSFHLSYWACSKPPLQLKRPSWL